MGNRANHQRARGHTLVTGLAFGFERSAGGADDEGAAKGAVLEAPAAPTRSADITPTALPAPAMIRRPVLPPSLALSLRLGN